MPLRRANPTTGVSSLFTNQIAHGAPLSAVLYCFGRKNEADFFNLCNSLVTVSNSHFRNKISIGLKTLKNLVHTIINKVFGFISTM